jgi:hypothetical protein
MPGSLQRLAIQKTKRFQTDGKGDASNPKNPNGAALETGSVH